MDPLFRVTSVSIMWNCDRPRQMRSATTVAEVAFGWTAFAPVDASGKVTVRCKTPEHAQGLFDRLSALMRPDKWPA